MSADRPSIAIPTWLRAILRCPVTSDELIDGVSPDGQPELVSPTLGKAYPVRDGVPLLLEHEARTLSNEEQS